MPPPAPSDCVQLAEEDPARCAALWRAARGRPAVIRTGPALPWVVERRTATERQPCRPTESPPLAAELVHFTSGTTGAPKPVGRTWASLDAGIKARPEFAGARWACAYPVDRFAGIQVVLACEANRATPVATPTATALAAAIGTCDAASATAAMWRAALSVGCRSGRLRQITLGGDAAGEDLLASLRATFPAARITQTYVSSEAGVICSWSDGLPGIPLAAFQRRARLGPGGEVLVARDARSAAGESPVGTGDLAEIRGDRVQVTGRRDAQINVGGHKIPAEAVEEIVRHSCPAVADCRARGAPNPILGQHVELEIVTDDEAAARRQLSAIAWPSRAWRPLATKPVAAIPRDPQQKVIRCAS
jgi:acyl-coenzyme A synthetase/AMP-(fatty) acid ligase